MLKQLTHVNVWVHDQDEALAFYTDKLGMELRDDVTVPEMGGFRWLSVGVPGQADVALALLPVPGPPVFDEETEKALRTIVAKGAAGGLFFATDDVQEIEELKGARRRVLAGADEAALRHRRRVPRPVGQPDPHGGARLEDRDTDGMAISVVPPPRHLLRAKDLIDARYRDPLDVPTLARAARLSPAHFSREFRRAFGDTPHQYLLTRRLERAAALLRNTDRSIADVCFSVGLRSVGRSRRASVAPTASRRLRTGLRTRPRRTGRASRRACCSRGRAPRPLSGARRAPEPPRAAPRCSRSRPRSRPRRSAARCRPRPARGSRGRTSGRRVPLELHAARPRAELLRVELAARQVAPPSTLTSTAAIGAWPDHARPSTVDGPRVDVRSRDMNSGMPGGTISARGNIRSAVPGILLVGGGGSRAPAGSPSNGTSSTVMRASHLTFVIPYQPGTSSRSGNPCCGGSGAPFNS